MKMGCSEHSDFLRKDTVAHKLKIDSNGFLEKNFLLRFVGQKIT